MMHFLVIQYFYTLHYRVNINKTLGEILMAAQRVKKILQDRHFYIKRGAFSNFTFNGNFILVFFNNIITDA